MYCIKDRYNDRFSKGHQIFTFDKKLKKLLSSEAK